MGRRNFKTALVTTVLLLVVYLLYSSYDGHGSYKTEPNSNKLQLLRELEANKEWKTKGFNFQPRLKPIPDESSITLQQLYQSIPYDSTSDFPKFIWQTWKVDLKDESFPKRYRNYQATWDDRNPSYKHFVIPDEQCDTLVEELYSEVPDVAKAYKNMPKSILKADFFRYLILFARGGVYTDIDTVGLKPIDEWAGNNEEIAGKANNAGLVVGIEADPDRPDWAEWYARRIQFCQWTIQSKRGHPMLAQLIAKITDITLTRLEKGQLRTVLGKDEGGDVMNWTGPGIFTDYVFKYLNQVVEVDWRLFTGMKQPILIDDVLVLPITSFSPDVNQMGARSSSDPMAFAKHMFSGSWKDDGMPGMGS